jgi:hypothetical protein
LKVDETSQWVLVTFPVSDKRLQVGIKFAMRQTASNIYYGDRET